VAAGVETDTLWVLHRAGRVWAGDTFTAASQFERIADESPIAEPVVLQLAKDTGAVLRRAVFIRLIWLRGFGEYVLGQHRLSGSGVRVALLRPAAKLCNL